MPRRPADKPWLHKASQTWCITLDGKRQYLDRDYKVACRKLRKLRAEQERARQGGREWLDALFADLADEFLTDVKARRAAGTYRNYREQLLRAMKAFGTNLRVGDVRKLHLAKIEQVMAEGFSPATVRDTIAAVQMTFNWAVRNDMLDMNPLQGYQKPAAGGRTRIMTPDEFQLLMRHADVRFRRFLLSLRMTGCRPGELRMLLWSMVDFDNALWVLPKHKTVTMQREPRPRIIPLPDQILKMCLAMAADETDEDAHVFLNAQGNPYSKDCVVKKMSRIRKRAGIEKKAGESLVLYSNRHTFATNSIGNVADTELAELLGHTTTRTLRRYVHLSSDRLHEIQRRALGHQ